MFLKGNHNISLFFYLFFHWEKKKFISFTLHVINSEHRPSEVWLLWTILHFLVTYTWFLFVSTQNNSLSYYSKKKRRHQIFYLFDNCGQCIQAHSDIHSHSLCHCMWIHADKDLNCIHQYLQQHNKTALNCFCKKGTKNISGTTF